MATEFDSQLIESVAVRRSRLANALLFGENPIQRRYRPSAKHFLFSLVAAALIAAVCVGVAFVSDLLADRQAEEERRRAGAGPAVVLGLPAHPAAAPARGA